MHRAELRKRYIFRFLALLLLALVAASLVRVAAAEKYLGARELGRYAGRTGLILDRDGGFLQDETGIINPELLGNLLSGNGVNRNALGVAYAGALAPDGYSLLWGIHGVAASPRKVLTTTLLSAGLQEQVAQAFQGKRGCCFSYNYRTGEIYTALSLPSQLTAAEDDGSGCLINRCLDARYIPGSTMKIVTSLCALEQDPALADRTYTCTGSLTLPDGNEVVCTGAHGTINFSTALGVSCNVYFASLIQELDVDAACGTLRELGFSVNGDDAPRADLGELTRLTSVTSFTGSSFSSVWSLVGQGDSCVNPVDMAMLAGAVAGGGQTARPYLVAGLGDEKDPGQTVGSPELVTLCSQAAAEQLAGMWSQAVDGFYRTGSSQMCSTITCAKTGTAQQGGGVVNKLLVGFMESRSTAFVIVVEDYRSGDPTPIEIANVLAQVLPEG